MKIFNPEEDSNSDEFNQIGQIIVATVIFLVIIACISGLLYVIKKNQR